MLDDGFAHVCRDEDGGGGAEGEDLLQDLAAVEIVVVELYGVGVCLLVIAGFFVVAREHHEAALDGVVLTLDAQSHALAAAIEKLLEGVFGACRDTRLEALDRLEVHDAHLNGALLIGLPNDEVVSIGRRVVLEAAGGADSLVDLAAAVAVGIGELVLLAQGLPDGRESLLQGRAVVALLLHRLPDCFARPFGDGGKLLAQLLAQFVGQQEGGAWILEHCAEPDELCRRRSRGNAIVEKETSRSVGLKEKERIDERIGPLKSSPVEIRQLLQDVRARHARPRRDRVDGAAERQEEL